MNSQPYKKTTKFVKTIRTLPNFALSESFWNDLYEDENKGKPKTESKLINFKNVRYPKIILFLSYIYNGHHWGKFSFSDRYSFKDKRKFKPCHSKVIECWMGSHHRKPILNTLEEHEYILVDHSYVISNSYAFLKSISKGYMIHPKFYDPKVYSKKKITLNVKEETLKRFKDPFAYLTFPKDKFVKIHSAGLESLKIDDELFNRIFQYLEKTKPSSVEKQKYIYKIKNECNKGKLESFKSFKNNNSGQRIYNPLQFLNREFRYAFDLGVEKKEVEVRNAVPYFISIAAIDANEDLSSEEKIKIKKIVHMRVHNFKKEGKKFNDISYPMLKEIIVNILEEIGFNDGWGVFMNEQLNARLKKMAEEYFKGKKNNEPYIKRKHDCSDAELKSIDLIIFLTICVFANSYRFIYNLTKEVGGNLFEDDSQELKKNINKYFNQTNYQRDNISNKNVDKFFNYYFPHLYNFLRSYGYKDKRLHYLTFNHEARLIVENVLPNFQKKHEGEPYVAIHDGIICRKSSAESCREMIIKYSLKEFGVPAPVSIKSIENPIDYQNSDFLDSLVLNS